ncbi:MAG TPA: AAA family ATPase, partial [bacterium]
DLPNDLFGQAEKQQRESIMRESIDEVATALQTLGKPNPWSPDIKASDDFLTPLFSKYFEKLKLPNVMPKTNYHILAKLVSKEKIVSEVTEKLDAIANVASKAKSKV